MSDDRPQVALVGDLHSAWDAEDVRYFNASRYELLLFTGDLGSGATGDALSIARSIASLRRPALVMLGNNDVPHYAAISAELTVQRGLAGLFAEDAAERAALTQTCGLSLHSLSLTGIDLTLIAARPFAMGGNECSSPSALFESYGIAGLDESRDRLRALVDSAPTEQVLFLAHNGPTGLGGSPRDSWGRDFGGQTGDWGDSDLADAVAYTKERGKKPLAVIAGHMHWSDRRPREWCVRRDGTLYVNAARVPRIFERAGVRRRVHVALTLSPESAAVRLVEVAAGAAVT
jgi:uncharacterized protein (TIGR04168 family)